MKTALFYTFFFFWMFRIASSQSDTISKPHKIFRTDNVVVTADRFPSLYSNTSRIIYTITANEISNSPERSIDGILKYAPNVDARQRGPFDVQTDIGLRCGTFDQTLILINGIKVNDAQTGHHNMDLPVSKSDIDRIEILEGPGSRVLGTNAFDGAINIITKEGDRKDFNIDISGGEHGLYNLSGSLSYNIRNFRNYFSVSKTGSKGYITDTDFQDNNLYYQGSVSTSAGNFNADFGYCDKAFGANSFYTPSFPNQYEVTKTLFASGKYSTGDKIKFSINAYERQHHDKFELFRDNPPDWYTGHNYHLTNVAGASTDVSFEWLCGRTSVGGEFRNENINSNVLGNITGDSIPVSGEDGAFYTRYASRNNISLFLEHNVNNMNFYFSGGFMLNWLTDYHLKTYGGFDLGYKINDNLHLFTSINQSLRIPTFTDLYYNGPTNTGNPDLKPEEAVTYEIGVKYLDNDFRTSISCFHRDGTNTIDWIRSADTLLWQSMNLTNVIANGMEFSVAYYPSKKLFAFFDVGSISISYAYTGLSKQSGNFQSNYVLDYLKQKLTICVNHSVFNNLGISWNILLESRAGTYLDVAYNTEKDYKPFVLLDAQLYYNYNSFRFYFGGTNLLNTFYRDHSYVPTPGRWLTGGFSYNLKWE